MPEGFQCELIHGEIFATRPSPTDRHQKISVQITRAFLYYLEGQSCQLRYAPYDVRLNAKEDNSDDIVLQPDILVICDEMKITENGCSGAPDLVVEIISLSTASRDYHEKRMLYEAFGVKEYWIVFPDGKAGSGHVLPMKGIRWANAKRVLVSFQRILFLPAFFVPGEIFSGPSCPWASKTE